jgi:hypothetical protein
MPGGSPTIIDLIVSTKPEFESALRHADNTAAAGSAELYPMIAYVERLLIQQLASIPTLAEPEP